MLELSDKTSDNIIDAIDHPIDMQIFKTTIYNNDIEEAMYRHKMSIMMAIVYSKFAVRQMTNMGDKQYHMSGFLEQEGRLPNENDKIRIIRGRYYFEPIADFILSEVWFEIVRPHK